MTGVTWILDDFALTAASTTSLLNREETLLHTYLTSTMTGTTGFHIIWILRTFTITCFTRRWCSKSNRFFHAFDCFFKRQFHHIAKIRATTLALLLATTATTESTTKNITKLAKDVFRTKTTTATETTLKGTMTSTIIHAAFFAIRKYFVSLCCFFKLFFRLSVIWVTIWMILHRQLTIGFFNLIITCGFRNA